MLSMADSFQIEIDETGEGVSAEVLRLQLDQALRFLRADAGTGEGVDWRVTRASMNSPLTLELHRWVPEGQAEPASRPGEQLARAFVRMGRGESLGEEMSLDQLHALERMVSQANGVRRVRVKAAVGEAITLDPAWATDLKKLRAERKNRDVLPEQPYSLVGRLEGVNVHGTKSEFYLYDPLTDQKMRCLFPDDMLEEVGRALGERVEVAGMTKFGPGAQPQSMRVESMQRIPTRGGSFLSRLEEAHNRGTINLTGGLSTEEAIDEVRGAPS